MVVASDWDDDTWRIHLDGCLTLLQHSYQKVIETALLEPLEQALWFVRDDTNTDFSLNTTTRNEEETTMLLFNVLKVRLRLLVQEFCTLTQGTMQPRKLDTLKLRLLMKRLLNDLNLLLSTSSPSTKNMSCTDRLNCEALRIVVGGILIKCGNMLDTTGSFDTTREYAKLNSLVRAAVSGIFTTIAALYHSIQHPGTASIAHGNVDESQASIASTPLSLIWPLFAAGIWASNEAAQQNWARETLFSIGKHYHIPLALHLVRTR